MCGFLGALSFGKPIQGYLRQLRAGLSAIRHRGPDSSASLSDIHVYLGHNRLSIIDLSNAATQPLRSANADAWVVFNGEIYNFRQLRQSLEPETHFVTQSDTEVLLEGYLREGVSFFEKLRGIYAFAIFDRRNGPRLILGRDPAGIKPLYYARTNDVFVFGSEIKALRPMLHDRLTINDGVLKAYLNLGYCPEPFTVYREIVALPPGHVLTVSENDWQERPVLRYDFGRENSLSFEENVEEVSALLQQAVERNLVADVETAVALSGGIDSSLIYAYATRADGRIRGLTVRFSDPDYDEASAAERYARHLSGNQLTLSLDADFDLHQLDDLLTHFDQPYADTSAIPTHYLTKATRQHSKVLLGGDGGDELFNGYASLARLPSIYRAQQLGIATVLKSMLALAGGLSNAHTSRTLSRARSLFSGRPTDMLFDWLSWLPRHTRFEGRSPFRFASDEGLAVYRQVFSEIEPDSFTARLIFEHFKKLLLSDYLRKTDMMSMLNGVEYRVPLLDEDLVQCALAIPFSQKSSWRRPKKFLRCLHERIFPAELSRAPKRGFAIPLDVYLMPRDLAKMRKLILHRDSFIRSYIRDEYLRFVLDAACGRRQEPRQLSREGTYHRLLLFYSLELWHRNLLSAPSASLGPDDVPAGHIDCVALDRGRTYVTVH